MRKDTLSRTLLLVASISSLLVQSLGAKPQNNESDNPTLWYRQPAKEWREALPVGNGRLGAMVFGMVGEERIQLNEETIWTGGPYDPSRPGAAEALHEVQQLVFKEEFLKAHNLFGRTMMGKPIEQMKYQSLGDLFLKFPGHEQPADYRRELCLDEAIVRVSYRIGDVNYLREVFSSPVDQAIVIRLTAGKPNSINVTANLRGVRNTAHSNYGDDFFRMDGAPPDELVLTGRTATFLAIPGRVRFEARLKAIVEDGNFNVDEINLNVTNATTVTFILVAATNFVNFNDVSADQASRVQGYFSKLKGRTYDQMKNDHLDAHRKLFRRVSLRLPASELSALPTDERISKLQQQDDPQLSALAFQFGRYILISSSRPGTQPANLQGIWNEDANPWWDSKYTVNINTEMNYWPAEVANLSECAEPLVTMMSEIASGPGRRIAQVHYGARGWVLHQNTDLWRASAPMDGPTWGTFATGGAWLCTNLWEHYLYTGSKEYLKTLYPILKGSAEFFLDVLVEHPKYGWLVTCPSTSPENFPKSKGNGRYYDEVTGLYLPGTSICAGSTIDMQILRDLFSECIQASETLGVDVDFREQVRKTRARLAPMQIGSKGQLREWLDDWDELEPGHRHVSQLYGLFPSNQITPRSTPKLAEAARQSLILRGDKTSGWAMAWRANLWARLGDGEHAYTIMRNTLAESTYPSLFSRGGRAMQVDGTFGLTSAVAEMLLQSHEGMIRLLPAIPKSWNNGSVKGLRARNGFEIDMNWDKGSITSARITSTNGNTCRIWIDRPIRVETKGAAVSVRTVEDHIIEFETTPGGVYAINAR